MEKHHDEIPKSPKENYGKCMETVGRILKPMKRLLAFHPAGDVNFKVFVTGSFVEAAF